MAEWSNAAVLKTVEGHTSGGSNPSFSAEETRNESCGFLINFIDDIKYILLNVILSFHSRKKVNKVEYLNVQTRKLKSLL